MKITDVINAFEYKGLKVSKVEQRFVTTILSIGNYIKVIYYHTGDEVFEMNLVGTMSIESSSHYDVLVKVMDIILNLLSDLTQEQRQALFDLLEVGTINDSKVDLGTQIIKYTLDEASFVYSVIDKRKDTPLKSGTDLVPWD